MIVPQDFFESTILSLFDQAGMNLTDAQKRTYIPQFQVQLERRISNEFTARLSEAELKEFVAMIDNENTTPEAWSNFWHTAIPNFEAELQKIVVAFSSEMVTLLA